MFEHIILGSLFLFNIVYFIRKYIIDKRIEKLQQQRNRDGHYVDLWDEAPYRCIHNVPPDKHTKECAWPIAHCYEIPKPTDNERKIRING